ncbi:MAG: Protein grpE [Pseudonocardia sp.]|jgi:molecular chaperone GrpE|nr:Protein grpE [Pseudonocardia sp.]
MTQDPNRHHRDEDGERVVVRNRRRIDPTTGEVRAPDSEVNSEPGARPGAGAAPAEPAATDAQVAELTAEVAERTADLQRLSAEYANYRRRVERDRESVLVNARAQFVGELLTVLDDIDRAGQHGDLAGPFKSVADKLVSVVQKLGLEPFGTVGEPFDPSVHEAVQHELAADDGPTVTILSAVLRRGYRIGDRVLRPAMVTVADTADDGTATEPSNGTDPGAVGTEGNSSAPESAQPHAGPA